MNPQHPLLPEHKKHDKRAQMARLSCPGPLHPAEHERRACTGVSFVFVHFSLQKNEKHARLGVFLVFGALLLTTHVVQARMSLFYVSPPPLPLPLPSHTDNAPFRHVIGVQHPPTSPIISRTPKARLKRRIFMFGFPFLTTLSSSLSSLLSPPPFFSPSPPSVFSLSSLLSPLSSLLSSFSSLLPHSFLPLLHLFSPSPLSSLSLFYLPFSVKYFLFESISFFVLLYTILLFI